MIQYTRVFFLTLPSLSPQRSYTKMEAGYSFKKRISRMSDRKYFNEEMETLPKDKLKKLQLERLQDIVERAYTQNQFYRKLYDEAGVKPSNIKYLEDIRKLPFLEKKTVRAAYPYGMAFKKPNDPDGHVEVHATSGTTGKSVPVFATKKDIDFWSYLIARAMWITGMIPGDIYS